MFGAPQQPATGTGFGAPATGTTQPSFGFGTPASAPAPAQGGLFGSPPSGGGGLFGATVASTSATGTSLFGAGAQQSPAVTQGGLFGTPSSAAPASGTPGLFGTPAQPAQPAGGGLFGTPAAAAPAQGGLFGTPAATAPAQGGLFGSAQTQPPVSLFGAPSATQPVGGSLFGGGQFNQPSQQSFQSQQPKGSIFGAGLQAQNAALGQQPMPVPAAPPALVGATPFAALPDTLKNNLVSAEKFIRDQRLKSIRLDQKRDLLDDNFAVTRQQCEAIGKQATGTACALERDRSIIQALKADVQAELKNAERTVVAAEAMRADAGQRMHFAHGPQQGELFQYFVRVVEVLEHRTFAYGREIAEIEEDAETWSGAATVGGNYGPESRAALVERVLRRVYDYFLAIASRLGTVHDNTRAMKEEYLSLLRIAQRLPIGEKVADPFEEADRREKAAKARQEEAARLALEASVPGQGAGEQAAQPVLNFTHGQQPGQLAPSPQPGAGLQPSSGSLFGGGFAAPQVGATAGTLGTTFGAGGSGAAGRRSSGSKKKR